MKKIKNFKQYISITIVCLLCFGMGICVPTILNQNNKEKFTKLQSVYSILKNKWYYADQVENLDDVLMEQAISGMADLDIDEHTNYFDLEQAKQFSSSLEGSNVGLGFIFYSDANKDFVVRNVFVNSPADNAKLQKGDIVTSIGDMKCAENDTKDVIEKIKSSEGKDLKVEYIRNDQVRQTTIIPASYDATVCLEIYEDYAHVTLSSFSEMSAQDFNEAIQRVKKKGIKKLILDLRDNTGGYLKSVIDISSTLLEKYSIVFKEETKDGEMKEQISSNKYEQVKFDTIVILQNENTASASEVLIGALKDHYPKKVKTVGTTTYGKGTEQTSIPFKDGTSMKYTIAQWYTPNGTSINKKGFKPDYEVEKPLVSTVSYSSFDETIKADTVNANAKALQVYLDYLGYTTDRKDEYFSLESSNALKQFQEDNGLEVSGDCDEKCFELLKEKVLLKINENMNTMDTQLMKALEIL